MALEAIVLMERTPLACIVISLDHMLLDPSFDGAIAITYGVHEAAGDDGDGDGSDGVSDTPTSASTAPQNCLAV